LARRAFLIALGSGALAAPLISLAPQQARVCALRSLNADDTNANGTSIGLMSTDFV